MLSDLKKWKFFENEHNRVFEHQKSIVEFLKVQIWIFEMFEESQNYGKKLLKN